MSQVFRCIAGVPDMDWEGALPKEYVTPGVKGVTGRIVVGPGMSPHFHLRYFRVEPGGNTSPDRHAHDHGVMILHGRAEVLLGEEIVELGPLDVLYIGGNEPHQLRAKGNEPLGFVCVVPAQR